MVENYSTKDQKNHYTFNSPEITDQQYDLLFAELKKLEARLEEVEALQEAQRNLLDSFIKLIASAIDAKSAKIDKKLKAIDLQLKKLKIDSDNQSKGSGDTGDTIDGEGFIISDRNQLLRDLEKNSNKKD